MCGTNDITKSPLIDTLDTTTGRPKKLLTEKSKCLTIDISVLGYQNLMGFGLKWS